MARRTSTRREPVHRGWRRRRWSVRLLQRLVDFLSPTAPWRNCGRWRRMRGRQGALSRRWRICLRLRMRLGSSTRSSRMFSWRIRICCILVAIVASWRARASAWRRRRWRSIVVGVVESRVGGLDARDGDGLIGATGNCDPEVQVVSVDNAVWAGVGRGEGGLHASPSNENVRAVVQVVGKMNERTPVCRCLRRLKPRDLESQIGEGGLPLTSELLVVWSGPGEHLSRD